MHKVRCPEEHFLIVNGEKKHSHGDVIKVQQLKLVRFQILGQCSVWGFFCVCVFVLVFCFVLFLLIMEATTSLNVLQSDSDCWLASSPYTVKRNKYISQVKRSFIFSLFTSASSHFRGMT